MALPFMIRRVELRNYRSIEHCDVELGPLMFLVGPNASGKSNFLDALRFVADCLNTSVEQALRSRGGFRWVCRMGAAKTFSIKLVLALGSEFSAEYFMEIGANSEERLYGIVRENCAITVWQGAEKKFHFARSLSGIEVQPETYHYPHPPPYALFLPFLSGWPHFGTLLLAMARMAFYTPKIDAIREHQKADEFVTRLDRDASNLAAVYRKISTERPDTAIRILEYLSVIVPRLRGITARDVGERLTLIYGETAQPGEDENALYASSMSDGTLRMTAILVALFQPMEATGGATSVGIEEPEMGLHPAAAEVLYDSLLEATQFRQVMITSHSSELLERDDIDPKSILAFSAEGGSTLVEPLDDTVRSILREKLSTPGELLRKDLLGPQRSLAR